MKFLKLNQSGVAIIGAIFIILIIGVSSMSMIELVSSENASSSNEFLTSQNMYVGMAGLEYVKRKLYLGQDPDVSNKSFASGTFTVTTDPSTRQVTVSSSFSGNSDDQVINSNFARNCVSFNTSTADVSGLELQNVKLVVSCASSGISQIVISKIWVTWNWGTPSDTLKWISFNNTQIYNAGSGIGSPGGSGAVSGQEIDVVDYTISSDGTYTFDGDPHDIGFIIAPTNQSTYTITIEFGDGSQITTTFQDP